MKRYLIIAPYNSREEEVFDKVWKYDLDKGTIAIGWTELGNVSKMNQEELQAKVKETYPEKSYTRILNSMWKFYHEISVGDIILARKGRKTMLGSGEVVGAPYYDEDKGKERVTDPSARVYSNFINVKWKEEVINFPKQVFSINALYEIPEDKYNSLIKGDKEPIEKEQQEFVLEKYLEDFIVSNFDKIFGNRLKLYKDEEGVGQQYPTDIGNIDILAKEPNSNSYIVIELKKGRESDTVVGQILRYIGWVKENLAEEHENVKGLIVCKERDEKLEYALKGMPGTNIEVKRYKVDFDLID